jgi:hypothetical protein
MTLIHAPYYPLPPWAIVLCILATAWYTWQQFKDKHKKQG